VGELRVYERAFGGIPFLGLLARSGLGVLGALRAEPQDEALAVDASMKIEVALFATLSKYLPPGAQNRRAVIEVKDGATVREVMDQLGVPADLPNILLVNGRQAPDQTVLRDGETLSVFPPLAGG
jgi:molybdopterin converting factor small subunit